MYDNIYVPPTTRSKSNNDNLKKSECCFVSMKIYNNPYSKMETYKEKMNKIGTVAKAQVFFINAEQKERAKIDLIEKELEVIYSII